MERKWSSREFELADRYGNKQCLRDAHKAHARGNLILLCLPSHDQTLLVKAFVLIFAFSSNIAVCTPVRTPNTDT